MKLGSSSWASGPHLPSSGITGKYTMPSWNILSLHHPRFTEIVSSARLWQNAWWKWLKGATMLHFSPAFHSVQYKVTWPMCLDASWWKRVVEGQEGLREELKMPRCQSRYLFPLLRSHILKFPESPRIVPQSGDQALSTRRMVICLFLFTRNTSYQAVTVKKQITPCS